MILAQTAYSQPEFIPQMQDFKALGTLPDGVSGPAVYSYSGPMTLVSE
jgi:hypothetical protein